MNKKIQDLPRHIAIIMDGNGRWAKKRLFPRTLGHREGIKAAQSITKKCIELGIEYLTLFAFSTENWDRPQKEIDTLWKYLNEFLLKESKNLIENDVKLRMIGFADRIPREVMVNIEEVLEKSSGNKGMNLIVALNYSGRSEIVNAFRQCIRMAMAGEGIINPEDFDESSIRNFLLTKDIPDPDLLIRTGGELRISNFLLYQIAYTELFFSEKFWPDFSDQDLMNAIESFKNRSRRFGTVVE